MVISPMNLYMKRILIGVMVLGCVSFISCATSEKVYICKSSSATKYHNSDECWGLNRCKSKIEEVSIEDAEDMGYTPCKICY